MESTLENAFLLLAVGMITVFIILALVVALGNLLIYITNRMYTVPIKETSSTVLPAKTVAVLAAVVEHVTAGKGSVSSIEPKS